MVVLLAREFAAGRWEKVLTFNARNDGNGPLALKWNGSVESMVVRNAARFLAAETKATEVFSEHAGRSYRATRVS